MNYDKWNKEFGGAKAVESLNKANTAGNNTEIPDGEYTCTLDKLELAESKTGKPMLKAQFRVTEGKYRKCCLFYNGVMAANDPSKSGYCIHNVIRFLKSLDILSESEIDFNGNFADFDDLVADMWDIAAKEHLRWVVNKTVKDDYAVVTVVEAL